MELRFVAEVLLRKSFLSAITTDRFPNGPEPLRPICLRNGCHAENHPRMLYIRLQTISVPYKRVAADISDARVGNALMTWRLRLLVRNLAIYVWFVFLLWLLRYWDPAFLHYDGPSDYLSVARAIGVVFLLSLGMLPVMAGIETGSDQPNVRRTAADIGPLMIGSFGLVMLCTLAHIVAAIVLSWVAPGFAATVERVIWP